MFSSITSANVDGLDESSTFSVPCGHDVSLGGLADSSIPVRRVRTPAPITSCETSEHFLTFTTSVLPLIYEEVGGAGRYQWMIIGYLIPKYAAIDQLR